MKRVSVLGCSGSGKSTFARKLGNITGLPVIHIDAVFWQPGWVEPDRSDFYSKMDTLAAGDKWIMDGNHSGTFPSRMPRTDTIVLFDYPRWICLSRVLWRIATTYGQVRQDTAAGCPERLDKAFLKHVWDYKNKRRVTYMAKVRQEGAHADLHIFTQDKEVRDFLNRIAMS